MPLNTIPNTGLTSRGYTTDRLVTPLIINGDMSVSQRATSTASVGASSTYPTIDRFGYRKGGSPSFRATMSQSSTVPTAQGFKYSFKVDCTTANTSLASSTRFGIDQKIEAQNLQFLEQGTSNAKATTLSFWVRSNLTGTYILWIYKEDGTARAIAKSYTINSADTWEKKIINIPGDTNAAGAIDNNNGEGWRITWHLAAGTTFNSGTLATSWENYSAANIAVGQVNFASSTDNEWYLTGVQLEVGEFDSTTLPSFPFESHISNLLKCKRYFWQDNHLWGSVASSTEVHVRGTHPVEMRALPSVSVSGAITIWQLSVAGSKTQSSANVSFDNQINNEQFFTAALNNFSSLTQHYPIAVNSGYVLFDAEL
tara:strand:- start:146 stop:1252 length:1107 start_codon:yes stop_codon:yes gene_type:complete